MPADLLDKVNESDPPPKKRGPRAGDWDPAGNPPGWDGKPEECLALTVYPDRMWTSSTRPDRIVESLQMLQSQGVIDGLEIQDGDDHPYRVTLPVGIVPLNEYQAALFVFGAVVGHLRSVFTSCT